MYRKVLLITLMGPFDCAKAFQALSAQELGEISAIRGAIGGAIGGALGGALQALPPPDDFSLEFQILPFPPKGHLPAPVSHLEPCCVANPKDSEHPIENPSPQHSPSSGISAAWLAALVKSDIVILTTDQGDCPSPSAVKALCVPHALVTLHGSMPFPCGLNQTELNALQDFWEPDDSVARLTFRLNRLLNVRVLGKDLRLTRHYLDTAMDSVPDLTWFKDMRGAHVKVNSAFCHAVGKSKKVIEGRGHYFIWDMKEEEYAKGEYVCLETDEATVAEGKTCLFDEKVKSRHGLRQFKTYKSPLWDEDGTIMGTVGVARDVTDLQNMGAEMELLLRSIPFAILVSGEDGRILKANQKFEEYFQISEADIQGQDYGQWKSHTLGLPEGERGRIMGYADIRMSHNGSMRIIEVHEEDIHDVFHSVVGTLGIFRDATIERTYDQTMRYNANTDMLTGLSNRRHFYEHTEDRKHEKLNLLYIDLDHFKQINDTLGHQVGDDTLVAVARLLRACFSEALIARVGGDEFLIALFGDIPVAVLEDAAQTFLQRMQTHFAEASPLKQLSASIGITRSHTPGLPIDSLIKESDIALYAAKNNGRARYCFFRPELKDMYEADATNKRPPKFRAEKRTKTDHA